MTTLEIDRDVAATKPDDKGDREKLRFEFNTETSGQNTRIDYKLVDHRAGLSAKASVVLEGRISADDVADLHEGLEGGRIFSTYKAGFPDLSEKMPASWNDSGEAVHVIERVAYTSHPAPDYLPSCDQFVASIVDYGAYNS